jgi:hypothetical protein
MLASLESDMHDPTSEDPSALAEAIRDVARRIQEHHVALDEKRQSSVAELVPIVERAIADPAFDEVGARAATMLGQTKDPRAVAVLLRALEGCAPGDALLDAATFALIAIGAPALEPLLARLDAAGRDDDVRYGCLEVLSQLGVRDDRIFEHLVRVQGLDRCFVASCFASYRDRRGLPHVHRVFDQLELTGDLHVDRDVLDLTAAIEELGGELTDAERRKLAAYEAARDGIPPRRNLGRNEPCWCGSGTKYKRCHEASDREED